MTLEFFSATDVGRQRDNNEDSVAVDEEAGLAILADGMGGYAAGEVASQMLTGFVCAELGRWLREPGKQAKAGDVKRAMDICVDNANRAIFNAANTNPRYTGMGTTLVLAVFRPEGLLLGHVGDSRAYRLRAGQFAQITRDHSLLQEQIDAGLLTAEEAAFSNNKNLVTRAVGVEDAVVLELHLHEVQPGDIYLMCSDGLSDMLSDARLAQILQGNTLLPEMAQSLITAANDMGGRDNIALILVRINSQGRVESRGWWPFGRRNR
ncbi:Stp1/IreP family PP2C-type Ser/Thr phosphatase [Roseateles paludis]|jgi:protein phosphatase|uniref:Stp1/IreP family PP2C-type Ser/Thr phosphatase n=1 Tax=Roseateles paludis TaxID=3145238 RepID=A0ABV0FY84_9BURK